MDTDSPPIPLALSPALVGDLLAWLRRCDRATSLTDLQVSTVLACHLMTTLEQYRAAHPATSDEHLLMALGIVGEAIAQMRAEARTNALRPRED